MAAGKIARLKLFADEFYRATAISMTVNDGQRVSGLLQAPPDAHACYVLAHGAGAGMTHPFLTAIADGLAERGIATLRYQFPYMEQGSKRPDVAEARSRHRSRGGAGSIATCS